MKPYNAAFRALATPRWQISDFVASMIGHGMLTRFPRLKVAIVEFFSDWMIPMVDQFERAYDAAPVLFDENPLEVMRRNIFFHVFSASDPVAVIDRIGVDNCMWGSDFPHPEGLRDPLAFSEAITGYTKDQQRKIMGGTLARLLDVA